MDLRAQRSSTDDVVKFYQWRISRDPDDFFNYHLALAGLAKVRSAQRRYNESIELYKKALAVIPMPVYAAALGDVYTKIGLPAAARKLYKNGRTAEASDAISKAMTLGTRDALLFFHAEMIYLDLRNTDKAKQYFSCALSTNRRFHVCMRRSRSESSGN